MTDPAWDYLRLDRQPTPDGRRVRIATRGELDSQTAPQFVRVVTELLTSPRLDRIEVDLAGLTLLDAAGIRALLRCEAAARRADVRLELRRATPLVLLVLDIVGLARHFGLRPAGGDLPAPASAPDDERDELLASVIRTRRRAHDICRRAQDAVWLSARRREP